MRVTKGRYYIDPGDGEIIKIVLVGKEGYGVKVVRPSRWASVGGIFSKGQISLRGTIFIDPFFKPCPELKAMLYEY